MKRSVYKISSLLIIAIFSATVWAEDAALRAKVEALYASYKQAIEAKDVDAVMANYSYDYLAIFMGIPKESQRDMIKGLFNLCQGDIRWSAKIESVEQKGDYIKVVSNILLEEKKDAKWTPISKNAYVEFLSEEKGALKIRSNAAINKERLKWIDGNQYKDGNTGVSLTAPKDWTIIPMIVPNMNDGVAVIAPDAVCVGVLGMLELPGNIGGKEAVEGDDAAAKRLAGDSYKLFQSGPRTVGGAEGYESVSQFQLVVDKAVFPERKRWRVYFKSGGLLYIFNFDAFPPDRWEKVKPGFESILNSFALSADAKANAANRLREKKAGGEVTGRIYTNREYGCQIAVPEGWKQKPTTLGDAYLFTVEMAPPQGKSLVRFLAVDTKGKLGLDDLVKGDIETIKILTKDFTSEPTQDIQVGSLKGKTYNIQFSLEGLGTVKRKCAMFIVKNIAYFIICDANPPAEYPTLESKFNEIIESLTIN
ncbi:MAG: hypothetical protein AB1656_24760 [Candidatus Omnitrophota bacterium]